MTSWGGEGTIMEGEGQGKGKLYSYFNNIRVRSFILNGAPISLKSRTPGVTDDSAISENGLFEHDAWRRGRAPGAMRGASAINCRWIRNASGRGLRRRAWIGPRFHAFAGHPLPLWGPARPKPK